MQFDGRAAIPHSYNRPHGHKYGIPAEPDRQVRRISISVVCFFSPYAALSAQIRLADRVVVEQALGVSREHDIARLQHVAPVGYG